MINPHGLLRRTRNGILKWAGELLSDHRGVSAVLSAMMLPFLIGFVGLAVDVGVWQVAKRNMQAAVDQAAYSAATASLSGATLEEAQAEAMSVLAQMGYVNGSEGVVVSVQNPASAGNYADDDNSWQVTASTEQGLFFSRLFLNVAPTLSVTAIALEGSATASPGSTTTTPGNGCILTLDTSASYATEVTNNGSVPNPSCAIYTNSSSSSALACYNNCSILANTYTVGNYYKGSGSATMSGTNRVSQAPVCRSIRQSYHAHCHANGYHLCK